MVNLLFCWRHFMFGANQLRNTAMTFIPDEQFGNFHIELLLTFFDRMVLVLLGRGLLRGCAVIRRPGILHISLSVLFWFLTKLFMLLRTRNNHLLSSSLTESVSQRSLTVLQTKHVATLLHQIRKGFNTVEACSVWSLRCQFASSFKDLERSDGVGRTYCIPADFKNDMSRTSRSNRAKWISKRFSEHQPSRGDCFLPSVVAHILREGLLVDTAWALHIE